MNQFKLMILALALGSLSIFSLACSRSYLPVRYYRIETTPKMKKSPENYGLSILIEDIWTPAFYNTGMVYQKSPYELAQYNTVSGRNHRENWFGGRLSTLCWLLISSVGSINQLTLRIRI